MKRFSFFMAVFLLFYYGCKDDQVILDDKTTVDRIILKTSGDRVVFQDNQTVVLTDFISGNKSSRLKSAKADEENFRLLLIAEVDAPEYNGKTIRASHIKLVDNYAFVSYNYEGDEYLGAIDIFDVTDSKKPKLISEAIFIDTDISAVDYDKGNLYLAEAVNLDETPLEGLTNSAALEIVPFTNNQISAQSKVIGLDSYVGTDVGVDDNNILVASGDDGSLYIIDRTTLETTQSIELSDIRSVTDAGVNYLVLQGNPGRLIGYNKSGSEEFRYTVGGAATIHSKTKIATDGNYAFIPLNEAGLKVINYKDGSEQASFARPATPEGGIDSDYVTNGVTVFNNFFLVANGGAGVYVGSIDESYSLEMLASLDLGASANLVQARENSNGNTTIFVAAGTSGLKILEMEKIATTPDDGYDYLGNYDELGSPIDKDHITLEDNILTDFTDLVPGIPIKGKYDPDILEDQVSEIDVIKETKLYLTFVFEEAGYYNTLGFYHYKKDNPPTSVDDLTLSIIHPNSSLVGSGGNMRAGDRVLLGTFDETDKIGFFLLSDAWNSYTSQIDDSKIKYRVYSNNSFNQDNQDQHLFLWNSGSKIVYLSFEDIHYPNGDKDFDDCVYFISDEDGNSINYTPLIDMSAYTTDK